MLSVIVPAFRAASTICETLRVLFESLDQIGCPYEVVLVPDGNGDDTAKRAARRFSKVRIAEYEEHRGKGFAIRHGIRHCRGEYIAYIDADLELHPHGLGPLLALVREGADVALGSKRHPESHIHYPLFRRIQSTLYQWLIRFLFRLHVSDTQTGLKVFRGDRVRAVLPWLTSDGFAFDLELLVALRDRGATFAEGPVRLEYRFASTIGATAVLQVLVDTLRIFRQRARRSLFGSPTVAAEPAPVPEEMLRETVSG